MFWEFSCRASSQQVIKYSNCSLWPMPQFSPSSMEPEILLCPPRQPLWPEDDSEEDPDYEVISEEDLASDCPTDSSQSSNKDADEGADRQDSDEDADPQGADEDIDLPLELHGLALAAEDSSASDQPMCVC
jgi:hypothetical protein